MKKILGFVLAPAIVPAVVVGMALAQGIDLRHSLIVGSIYGAFTWGAALLLGLPVFTSFSRRGWTSWWQYVILGVVIGVLVLLLIFLAHGRFIFDSRVFLIFIAAGVVTASAFWFIAVRGRRE